MWSSMGHRNALHTDPVSDLLTQCLSLSVQNGFSIVPTSLAEGLNIRFNTAVREVVYSTKGMIFLVILSLFGILDVGDLWTFTQMLLTTRFSGAEVTVVALNDDSDNDIAEIQRTEKLKADAVVCTIPLGYVC